MFCDVMTIMLTVMMIIMMKIMMMMITTTTTTMVTMMMITVTRMMMMMMAMTVIMMMAMKVSKDGAITKILLGPSYGRSLVIVHLSLPEAQFFIKKRIEASKDITSASHKAKVHVPFTS